MARRSRRGWIDPRRAKLHHSYTIAEAAALFGVHRNTVRNWIGKGLGAIKANGLVLILGEELRRYLGKERDGGRVKCPPGSMYCFKCRAARRPPDGLVEAVQVSPTSLNLRGLCPECGCLMHRRCNSAGLVRAGFGQVAPTQAQPHLADSPVPSLHCHQTEAA
jgi:excisionase family DNA binding protein